MKTAFLCNISEHWKNKQSFLMEQINIAVPAEKEIFIVNRSEADSIERYLEKIVQNKFDRIVVAGGDGTVNRVIRFLFKKNVLQKFVLGIIPMGTCNDFSRYLGIKSGEIKMALKAILKNSVREITVAQVNGQVFFNNAGFGKKNPMEKKKSPVSIIRDMEPVGLKAKWGEQSLEGKFFMMLCANAPYFSGGLYFSKRPDPRDNELEFYFVKSISKTRLFLKLLLGRAHIPLHFPSFSRSILHVKCPKLSIETERPVSIVTDGEPLVELLQTTRATFEVASRCVFLVSE